MNKLFRNLVSIIKISIYRIKGYSIGNGVYIEHGSKIEGNKVIIGKNTYIGRNVIIQSKTIILGENCVIFPNVNIHTEKFLMMKRGKLSRNCIFKANCIKIGRDFWCNENVEAGGGGWQKKTSKLRIGSYTHVGKNAHFNVCQAIKIKGKTGVGMDCMIFTHSSGNGQSILEGYPVSEERVEIDTNVSLYSRVIVIPGTIIKKGVTVGAGALAKGMLDENSFYAGIPAKLISKVLPKNDDEKLNILKGIILNMLPDCTVTENNYTIFVKNEIAVLLSFSINEEIISAVEQQHQDKSIICIYLDGNIKLNSKNTGINLGNSTITGTSNDISEKIRDEFRRKGIILRMINYKPKLLSYNGLVKAGIELE